MNEHFDRDYYVMKNNGEYVFTGSTIWSRTPSLTLKDYWAENPISENDLRLGPYTLVVPPNTISVSRVFGYSPMTGPTVRQSTNTKINTGSTRTIVTMSLYFSNQGDNLDLSGSTDMEEGYAGLTDLIILFKGCPFIAVENKLLNETYGIQALCSDSMTIENINNYPGVLVVNLKMTVFDFKIYQDVENFSEIIDYHKLMVYLGRGRTIYEHKSKQFSNYEYEGGDYYHLPTFNKINFDLEFNKYAPAGMYFDTTAIAAGDSMSIIGNWAVDKENVDFESDPDGFMDKMRSYGFLSGDNWDNFEENLDFNYTKAIDLIDYITNKTDARVMKQLTDQFLIMTKSEDLEYDDATLKKLASLYIAQVGFDAIKQKLSEIQEEGDTTNPLYIPENPNDPGWINEQELNLESLNLSEAVIVRGISVSMSNLFGALPIQMGEEGATQYLGGDDTICRINLILRGEEDLNKIMQAFRLNQAIVRATKAKVSSGFIGIKSPLTVLCGTRTFMPVSIDASTINNFPHTYSVDMTFVDFDLYQQKRELLSRVHNLDEFKKNWTGHPSLRLQDQENAFNLYPDLYLTQLPNGQWEQPDFYFIPTPEPVPTELISKQDIFVNNVHSEYNKLGLEAIGGKFQLTMNGEPIPWGAEKLQTVKDANGEPIPTRTPQSDKDIDFAENAAEMYRDYASSNLRGHMRKAFPTFFFALIDEPRQLMFYRTYTDFYSRRGITSMTVNRSWNPMEEVAIVSLTDAYRRLSYDPQREDEVGTRHGLGWFASTLYSDTAMMFTKAGATTTVESIEIQAGMRIHLKMGYSNSLNDLRIVFNGTITELAPQANGAEISITAQGDGRELLGVINNSKNDEDTADVSGLFYSEPRELIVRVLTLQASSWRKAFSLITGGAWHPEPRNGIRHFGELLMYNRADDELTKEERENAADARMKEIEATAREMTDVAGALSNTEYNLNVTPVVGDEIGGIDFENLESTNIDLAIDNMSLFSASLTAASNLYLGWDYNIFARNIYPATESGLVEASRYTADALETGAIGDGLRGFLKEIVDTLDFTAEEDEPSYKAWTYMRTVWDIIQQCADLMPNYIVAVRPFNHRSTLFYGRPYFQYTSGVKPVQGMIKDYSFKVMSPESLLFLIENMGYYKVTQILTTTKADSGRLNLSTESSYTPTRYESGIVDGKWLDENILNGTGFAGKGNLISSLSKKYNIPWDLALGMLHQETSFMAAPNTASIRCNNPGNIKWGSGLHAPWRVPPTDQKDPKSPFIKYPTLDRGLEAYFQLLHSNIYQEYFLEDGTVNLGKYLGGDIHDVNNYEMGLIVEYAPPKENDTRTYINNVNMLMERWTSQANEAGAIREIPDADAVARRVGEVDKDTIFPNVGEKAAEKYPAIAKKIKEEFEGGEFEKLKDELRDNLFYSYGSHPSNRDERPFLKPDWNNKYGGFGTLGSPRNLLRDNKAWDEFLEQADNGNRKITTVINGEEKEFDLDDDELIFAMQEEFIDYYAKKFVDFMVNGNGVEVWADYLDKNGRYNIHDLSIEVHGVVSFFQKAVSASGVFDPENELRDFATISLLEAGRNGLRMSVQFNDRTNNPEMVVRYWNGETNTYLPNSFWTEWGSPGTGFWENPEYSHAIDQSITSTTDLVKGLVRGSLDLIYTILGLIPKIGDFLQGAIQIGMSILGQLFNTANLSKYMSDLSKDMAGYLYDSEYHWGTIDNPFTREFGEEVLEIREPFMKLHKVDSFHEIIANTISVSDRDVYPVVTSVSRGKKPRTVYADKSIAPEFQKELVYENNLNFDILNFRDGIHAKRIGLAACARSIKSMYQGNIAILGDPKIEPYDMLYIADLSTDMWGMCQVREVTHSLNAYTGFTTQISVMPIVAVDDPAQWAVSTVLSDFFKSFMIGTAFAKSGGAEEVKAEYAGLTNYSRMRKWVEENKNERFLWYDVSVGAGLVASFILLSLAYVSIPAAAPFLFGSSLLTGGAIALNPEKMASLVQYFDEQQDLWIQLLVRRGELFQAGLTGSTGIVVGKQRSVGLDVLDLFSRDQPILTIDDLWSKLGMNKVEIKEWNLDLQYFRNKNIIDFINQDFINSVWTLPENKTWIDEIVTLEYVIDGDTIKVTDSKGIEKSIRFNGFDSPEVEKDSEGKYKTWAEGEAPPEWAMGEDAAKYLDNRLTNLLAGGGYLRLRIHPDYQLDLYGRTLAWVEYIPEGWPDTGEPINLNLEMIKSGYGQIWAKAEEYQRDEEE